MEAIILGGGNVGDVRRTLDEVERLMAERVGKVTARSALYTSRAWGFESENDFTNRAWAVDTALEGEALLNALQAIENALGRDRAAEIEEKGRSGERYTSRAIDLDILLFGERRIATPRLSVPHPLIMERDFVLRPLGELLQMTREEIGEVIKRIETR